MFRHVTRIAALAALIAAPAAGQTLLGLGAAEDRATLRLLEGWRTEDGARMAGLRIDLGAGWKTYWRAPGGNGIPPRFDWAGSQNVAAVEVLWPRPSLLPGPGGVTIGYERQVVFPLRVTPKDPAAPLDLALTLDFGVCADVCVPERADVATLIPAGFEHPDPLIRDALTEQAEQARDHGLLSATCAVRGAGEERRFDGDFTFDAAVTDDPLVVVEAGEDVWFSAADVAIDGPKINVVADAYVAAQDLWIDRAAIRVTFLTPDRALELSGCASG